jgi:hypothetical protein
MHHPLEMLLLHHLAIVQNRISSFKSLCDGTCKSSRVVNAVSCTVTNHMSLRKINQIKASTIDRARPTVSLSRKTDANARKELKLINASTSRSRPHLFPSLQHGSMPPAPSSSPITPHLWSPPPMGDGGGGVQRRHSAMAMA